MGGDAWKRTATRQPAHAWHGVCMYARTYARTHVLTSSSSTSTSTYVTVCTYNMYIRREFRHMRSMGEDVVGDEDENGQEEEDEEDEASGEEEEGARRRTSKGNGKYVRMHVRTFAQNSVQY